jgi:hypothetical protein
MFNIVVRIMIIVVFCLAFLDAWMTTGTLGASVSIALAPTLILVLVFLVAAYLGRKTRRRTLFRTAASLILALGVAAYAAYAMPGPPGDPDTASQMHVFFFPAVLAFLAIVVMGVCAAAAWLGAWDPDV